MGQTSRYSMLAVDSTGSIYTTANGNNNSTPVIYKVNPATGQVTSFAGSSVSGFADGQGAAALFSNPQQVAVDPTGSIYVADAGNNRIRKISPSGLVSTLAGGVQGFANGPAASAQFWGPSGVAVDGAGNVYVADTNNFSVRKIDATGRVTTVAGGTSGTADGIGAAAQFGTMVAIAADGFGNLYVTENSNPQRVRLVTTSGRVRTVASVSQPNQVAVDPAGNLYVAGNSGILKIVRQPPGP